MWNTIASFPQPSSKVLLKSLCMQEYTLYQNGRYLKILLFLFKLALDASFVSLKFKRMFCLERGTLRSYLNKNKGISKWRPFWKKLYRINVVDNLNGLLLVTCKTLHVSLLFNVFFSCFYIWTWRLVIKKDMKTDKSFLLKWNSMLFIKMVALAL